MRHGGGEYCTVERQVNALAGEGIKETCRVPDKQNAIMLWTRRALRHRSRHQELFDGYRLGKTLPQFRVSLHGLGHKDLGFVLRCSQMRRAYDHTDVDQCVTYRRETDVPRWDQKHFSPGLQGVDTCIMRHERHVLEPADAPHQAKPSSQGR